MYVVCYSHKMWRTTASTIQATNWSKTPYLHFQTTGVRVNNKHVHDPVQQNIDCFASWTSFMQINFIMARAENSSSVMFVLGTYLQELDSKFDKDWVHFP